LTQAIQPIRLAPVYLLAFSWTALVGWIVVAVGLAGLVAALVLFQRSGDTMKAGGVVVGAIAVIVAGTVIVSDGAPPICEKKPLEWAC